MPEYYERRKPMYTVEVYNKNKKLIETYHSNRTESETDGYCKS